MPRIARGRVCGLLLLFVLAGCAPSESTPQIDIDYERYTLANGLEVD
ncbi:MAG: hypothetical protein ACI84D_002242 [Thalassolituus oleivorans]|jgi:hypothetical protein